MSAPREDLLQPTLTGTAPAAAPYSVQTTFLTGFFGGPFAALAILVMNSFRLRRAARDAFVWGALLVMLVIGGWLVFHSAAGADVRSWFKDQLGGRAASFAASALGVAIVGVGYLLHRREQLNSDLMGLTRPNGWIGGLGSIAVGLALSVAFFAIIME